MRNSNENQGEKHQLEEDLLVYNKNQAEEDQFEEDFFVHNKYQLEEDTLVHHEDQFEEEDVLVRGEDATVHCDWTANPEYGDVNDSDSDDADYECEEDRSSEQDSDEFTDLEGVSDEEVIAVRSMRKQDKRSKKKKKKKTEYPNVEVGETSRESELRISVGPPNIIGGPELAHEVVFEQEEVSDLNGYETEWDSSDHDSPLESSSDSDGCSRKRLKKTKTYPIYNPAEIWTTDPEDGLRFASTKEAKMMLTSWAVRNGYQLHFERSCTKDLKVGCQPGCPFWIYISKMQSEDSFQIKVYKKKHTCVADYHVRVANSEFLAGLYQNQIMKNPKIKLRDLKDDIEQKYGLRVNKDRCAKVKKLCLGEVDNVLKVHYGKLRDYCHELLRANPGSTIKISANDGVFERVYICFEALKRGWKSGCRPVIGLDGAFLKGFVKGEILTAVGRDANNQMYPIAWAVTEGENKSSWKWFLELLKDDLDIIEGGGLTLISDKQKGLVETITEILPQAEHRNCARHIYANFRKDFGGAKMKKYFWMLCKTGNEQHYKNLMKLIEGKSKLAHDYLVARGTEHFCRAFFQEYSVCESVENNMCEVLNAVLIEPRHKSIIEMLEDIRIYMMERIVKRRNTISSWVGELGPRIRARIDKGKEDSRNWLCTHNGDNNFEVKHVRGEHGYTVDMNKKTCSCGLWSLSGIPCTHAICSIYYLRDQPEKYVSEWYHISKMQIAYSHSLQPINGESLWERHEYEPLLPPIKRRMPGRPKTNRRKEFHENGSSSRAKKVGNEDGSSSRVSRVGRVMHCSRCRQTDHRVSKCPVPEDANTAQSSKGKKKKAAASQEGENDATIERGKGAEGTHPQPSKGKRRKTTVREGDEISNLKERRTKTVPIESTTSKVSNDQPKFKHPRTLIQMALDARKGKVTSLPPRVNSTPPPQASQSSQVESTTSPRENSTPPPQASQSSQVESTTLKKASNDLPKFKHLKTLKQMAADALKEKKRVKTKSLSLL